MFSKEKHLGTQRKAKMVPAIVDAALAHFKSKPIVLATATMSFGKQQRYFSLLHKIITTKNQVNNTNNNNNNNNSKCYCTTSSTGTGTAKRLYMKKYHEPEYLELMKPKVPYFELYNIQLRGYDFAVVESLLTLVIRLCKDAGCTIGKTWAIPATILKYETYADESSHIENTEEVKIHERTVQINNMTTTQLAILLDVVNQAKPPGVIVSFMEHNQGHEDVRYIPDLKLAAAEKELEELKKPLSLLGKS